MTEDFKDHFNYKHLKTNFNLIASSGLVLFIGAGLSCPLFPSWGQFLSKLFNAAKNTGRLSPEDITLIEDWIKVGKDYLYIAKKCVNVIGEQSYRSLILECFDIEFDEKDVSDNYKAAMSLSANLLITTNYDRVPDVLSAGKYRVFSRHNASEALATYSSGKKVVLKIHGDILHQDSIILTSEDFRKSIYEDQAVNHFLRSIFQTKTVLFLGFSLTDPHINLILDFIKSTHKDLLQHHYAFIPKISSLEVEKFESDFGVRVIPFVPAEGKNYLEIKEFLDSLLPSTAITMPEALARQVINDEVQLHDKIVESLKALISNQVFCFQIDAPSKFLDVYFTPRSETPIEFQREILYILEHFDVRSDLFENISLCTFMLSQSPSLDHTEFESIRQKINVSIENIDKYIKKEISAEDLWKSLVVFVYDKVGTMNFKGQEVRISYVKY